MPERPQGVGEALGHLQQLGVGDGPAPLVAGRVLGVLGLPVQRDPVARCRPRRGGRGSWPRRSACRRRTTWPRAGPTSPGPARRARSSRACRPTRPTRPRGRRPPARRSRGRSRSPAPRTPAAGEGLLGVEQDVELAVPLALFRFRLGHLSSSGTRNLSGHAAVDTVSAPGEVRVMLKPGNRALVRIQLALALALSMLLVPAAAQGAVLYDSTPSFGGHPPGDSGLRDLAGRQRHPRRR